MVAARVIPGADPRKALPVPGRARAVNSGKTRLPKLALHMDPERNLDLTANGVVVKARQERAGKVRGPSRARAEALARRTPRRETRVLMLTDTMGVGKLRKTVSKKQHRRPVRLLLM